MRRVVLEPLPVSGDVMGNQQQQRGELVVTSVFGYMMRSGSYMCGQSSRLIRRQSYSGSFLSRQWTEMAYDYMDWMGVTERDDTIIVSECSLFHRQPVHYFLYYSAFPKWFVSFPPSDSSR